MGIIESTQLEQPLNKVATLALALYIALGFTLLPIAGRFCIYEPWRSVIHTCVAVAWTYRNRGFRSSSSTNSEWIPGPKGSPFTGNLKDLRTDGAASCKTWFALFKQYGPAYELTVPFFRLHIINHPTYLEHIQKNNSKNYIRGAFTRNTFSALHRTGIFVSDGEQWKLQRKVATRAFSKKNFENHITESIHHWLNILLELLHRMAEQSRTFDFQELMGRFMFCLFLRVAFHEDALALEVMSDDIKSLESMPEYVRAFDEALYRELGLRRIDQQ
jgi:hypothetical protein